ncbi:MAG: methyltransferase domain-containing protein [Bryobacterales bacterium]|nr:methyltransferase domain-containing protein [Bryobacterales bacterium]
MMDMMDTPNPELVWNTITAHQRSAALRAAVDVGVFAVLSEAPRTAAEIAERCHVPERGIRILCDFLTIHGLIAKRDGGYIHTATSAVFLSPHSPASLAPSVRFLMNNKIMQASSRLTETIRRGHTALDVPLAGEEVDEWVTFARTMQPFVAGAAEFMAGQLDKGAPPKKVLDVAASHGMFGLAVARHSPGCEIVALDFPSVLEVTAEHARNAGVALTLLPGSAFTADLGDGYDGILVTNLFHHFSQAECVSLMKRFHAALIPGGRLLVLEFVPNDDRVTPPLPASFSMMMLANTAEGDAFTRSQYTEMLQEAGFAACEFMDVPQSPQQLIVAVR